MKVVGVEGFEPTADGLRDRYSTAELHPHRVGDFLRGSPNSPHFTPQGSKSSYACQRW